jgi:DNA-binding IclR family transcriptional regulator
VSRLRPFPTARSACPAHATALGKALLAFSTPDVVDKVIGQGLTRYTAATITTACQLVHSLTTTRRRGLAFERGELAKGYLAAATPIFGPRGEIVGALAVRLHQGTTEVSSVLPALTVAGGTLSRELDQLTRPRLLDHRP